MSTRAFLLICLSFAFATLIVSEVAVARELADTSAESLNNEVDSAEGVEESTSPGVGYGINSPPPPPPYPGPGNALGNCPHGCCGRTYPRCSICCSYAGEAVDAEPQTQP